jgi:hypothetical protein
MKCDAYIRALAGSMMTLHQIRAIGSFLATYQSDLTYIDNFRNYRKNKITADSFCQKGDHTFYSFLSEFRVTRNFKKFKCDEILCHTIQWLENGNLTEVDCFALCLRKTGLTHEKTMTSLSSKILFLNNPQTIIPFDNRVKRSVNQDSNLYSDYISKIRSYRKRNKKEIEMCLKKVEPFAKKIERNFTHLKTIEAIRKNRLVDKLLWTLNGQPDD